MLWQKTLGTLFFLIASQVSAVQTNPGWYYRLSSDMHLSEPYILNDDVTVNLNGFTVTSDDLDYIFHVNGDRVKIVNGSIDGQGGSRGGILVNGDNTVISDVSIVNINSGASRDRGAGVRAITVKRLLINNVIVKNISYPSVSLEENFLGRGMYITDSDSVVISGCNVSNILNTGIDFTSSTNVTLLNNKVADTAMKFLVNPGTAHTGDSYTAYHNQHNGQRANFVLIGNESMGSHNAGIHVSGLSTFIYKNNISDSRNVSISVGDWRIPYELSKNSVVLHNDMTHGQLYGKSVHFHSFINPSWTFDQNTYTGSILTELRL